MVDLNLIDQQHTNIQNKVRTVLRNRPDVVQKIKQVYNTPAYSTLSDMDKSDIQTAVTFAPEFFEEPKTIEPVKTEYQTANELAQKKALQAKLSGYINNDLYQNLLKRGLVPDLNNKNFWGRLGASTTFPLNKILSAFQAFPRALSAMDSELVRQVGVDEAKRYGFLYQPKLEKGKTYTQKELLEVYDKFKDLKAPTSQADITKAGLQAFVNKKGSKYQDWNWAKQGKEADPKSAEPYAFTKRIWENERKWNEIQALFDSGSITSEEKAKREKAVFEEYGYRPAWITKAVTAIAGSPADVRGLFLDIFTDPLTYISGGASKGYKIADTSFDLVNDAGKVLVPKGSTVVFTEAGKEILQNSMEELLPKVKTLFANEIDNIGTAIGKNAFTNRKIAELALKNTAKSWTVETMGKFIDLGGLKYMGQTVIPGYKLQKTFGKSMEKIAEIPFLKPINKLFNPYYGVPEALRPTKAYSESLMRTIYGQDMADIMRAVSPLGTSERKTLNTLMIAERDIYKITNKLDDVIVKIQDDIARTGTSKFKGIATGYESKISKLDDIIKNLNITPKVAEAKPKISEVLENMFKREAPYLDYEQMQKYFPGVVKRGKVPIKTSVLSAEEAFFERPQTQDLLKMLRKGVEPEDLVTALSKRAKAGALRIGRAENLEAMKQFGSMTPAAGLDELLDNSGKVVKELKGWYFPAEYKDTFARAYQTFFGDDAVNKIAKVHDRILTVWKRWALATPGYHARNFYSDMWSGAMEYGDDFFNLRRWEQAYEANVLRKPISIAGQIYSPDDLAKVGITTGTQYATEGMVRQGLFASTIEKGSPAYWSVKFGNIREGMGRTVAGIIELEKGGTLIDAAFNVKKVFYDYMALTPFEINVGRRVFPFYTWLRKNSQRQVELLFTRTGRYAATAKSLNYLENVAETRFGKEKMAEYEANKPDYYNQLGATITAMTNKEGQPLVLNPNLPFQDWGKLNPNDLASSLSPFLKIPIELKTNKDLFFNTTIDRAREGQGNYREAPQWISVIASPLPNDILKYMGMEKANGKVYMTDLTSYLIRQVPPFYVMQRMLPADQTPKTPLDWLSVGIGIKFFNFDIEKEKKNRLNDFIAEVNTELGKRRQTGAAIPDINNLESAYKQIYINYMTKKYNMGSISYIEDLVTYSGSTGDRTMLKAMRKPFDDAMDKIKGKSLTELADILTGLGISPTLDEINKVLNQLDMTGR